MSEKEIMLKDLELQELEARKFFEYRRFAKAPITETLRRITLDTDVRRMRRELINLRAQIFQTEPIGVAGVRPVPKTED